MIAAWRESIFAPSRFFPQLGRVEGVLPSVLYYLGLGLVVAGVGLFWRMVLPMPEARGPLAELLLTGGRGSPLLDFLLSPLVLLGSLALGAAAVHVLLLILGGGDAGFATTVRVLCFAYGPQIFAVVPLVGTVVGAIWSVVLTIAGLRYAHATSGWRAAVAVLLPLFVVLAFGVLAALLIALGSVRV